LTSARVGTIPSRLSTLAPPWLGLVRVDFNWYAIAFLRMFGLVWDVKTRNFSTSLEHSSIKMKIAKPS
jgi:hypothetical protein